MKRKPIKRKEFIAGMGKAGAGACLCAAAAGMKAAFGGQTSTSKPVPPAAPPVQTKPGDKTMERNAKRMEFGDQWVRRFFEAIDKTLDEPARKRLMVANGRSCFAAYAGPPKKQPAADAVEKFRAWIAAKGKEKGYSTDGRTILFEFASSAETGEAPPPSVCLCSMAEAQKAGTISPTYCLCSVGYVQEMHERALGRPVEVELVDSILRGGKRCRFRLTVA